MEYSDYNIVVHRPAKEMENPFETIFKAFGGDFRTFISHKFISLADLDLEDVEMLIGKKLEKSKKERFIENECYYLQNEPIEGFEQKKRLFKIVKHIPSYKGEPINSVIVKRVGDNHNGNMFTLTKSDCRKLGLNYESGLEIYPSTFPFIKCEQQETETKDYKVDYNDLSKYPASSFDDRIHEIILQVSGCRYVNGFIRTPNGFLVHDDLRELKVYVNKYGFVRFKVMKTTSMAEKKIDGIIDENGMIYISAIIEIGIKPSTLRNVPLNQLITIKVKE